VAEDINVRTPVLVNLDGFVLTHTYEAVSVPAPEDVDAFLPAGDLPDGFPGTFSNTTPQSLAITAGPGDYTVFKYQQHAAMLNASGAIRATARRFQQHFGRGAEDLIERYRSEDAEVILITLGSIAGTVRSAIDTLREQGVRAGLLRIRYLRPFPAEELGSALFAGRDAQPVLAIGVLEKDISFGHQGSVSLEVKAALFEHASRHAARAIPVVNFIAGLGGQDISQEHILGMFADLQNLQRKSECGLNAPGLTDVRFLGLEQFRE